MVKNLLTPKSPLSWETSAKATAVAKAGPVSSEGSTGGVTITRNHHWEIDNALIGFESGCKKECIGTIIINTLSRNGSNSKPGASNGMMLAETG